MTRINQLFSLILILSAFYASAKTLTVYTWVDENGIAHFSYLEPKNNKSYQSFELKETRPSVEKNAQNAAKNKESEQSLTPEKVETEVDSLSDRRKEYCEKAKYNLEILENYPQVKQVDSRGEQAYISKQQQAEYKKQAKQRIKVFCK